MASAAVAARPDARGGRVSSAMSSWPTVRCSTSLRCARTRSNTCPPSWCRRPGSSTRHCHHAKRQDRSARARSVRPPEPGVGATGTPSTRSEQLLAEIWQSVLGTMRVGHDDDFFALGGHSPLAAQVVVRVRTVFGWTFHACGFDHPTWQRWPQDRASARRLGRAEKRRHRAPRRYRSRAAHFGQQRSWFVDMLDPGRPTYNTAAVIRIRGPLDSAAMGRAIDQLPTATRRCAPPTNSSSMRPVQRVRPHVVHELEVVDHSDLPAECIEKCICDGARAGHAAVRSRRG